MRQQQQWQQQTQKRAFPPRFLWVILILIASLAAIYLYVIPFLASVGGGSTGSVFSGGWSASQQRHIAFTLAQRIQSYRQSINEQRRINYGDAYMVATGIKPPFRPQQPYEGVDSQSGAKNDTHSETRLKGWALATIRQKLHSLPSGSTINIVIVTQVKVCPDCRKDSNGWATQLQQAAPPRVRVNFYIWQQTNFDIDHPDQTPVISPDEVQ
ncbi:MAG: hypothetical protein M3Y81_06960, partial [Chloroflexota bacterium]|nr:hypothetical protein [Chloroflexota bacterium]